MNPKANAGQKIAFLMVIGPGEGRIALEAVNTILHAYPNCKLWLRDDCTSDGTWKMLETVAAGSPERIDLVRNPKPLGYRGIAVSAFRSFDRICQSGELFEMVVQLDPDVLLLGDEIVHLARAKFAAEGPGIIGAYMLSAAKERRSHASHRNHILADLVPFGFDRNHKLLRFGFPFYARYLPKAIRNGYRLGHHVLGAFYILHGETLRALDKEGFWKAMPELGSREVKLDDPLVSIGPFIVGHKLIELHDREDSRFWIQLQNPLKLPPEEIVARKYLALHPLKPDQQGTQLRADVAAVLHRPASTGRLPVP